VTDEIVRRIEREAGVPGLAERLAAMPGADLRSLLLDVARRRSAERTPADLMADRGRDGTVAAAPTDARLLRRAEVLALEAAEEFEAVELSPVCPGGLNTVLGRIGQDNVLATVRGSEVMADPTAALALEAAVRRRVADPTVRLATTHRVLRLQPLSGDGIVLRHFRLLALVTAGPSEPGNGFETDALVEHAGVHIRLLRRTQASEIRVTVSDAARPAVAERALERLAEVYPDVLVASDPEREHGVGYYAGAMLNVTAYTSAGDAVDLGDGGETDWTARLLQNRKERLYTSGIGLDRLVSLM
jgi:hypothetical protein